MCHAWLKEVHVDKQISYTHKCMPGTISKIDVEVNQACLFTQVSSVK